MYKKARLENGVRLITNYMPAMQSVALGIWIKTGGRHETAENKGISHYLEHLLFKGTKKYSCSKLKESIEGVGGSLNGFTSEEATCYLVKLPGRHLNLALSTLADMVINPLLPVAEVEKERTVILEELKMYRDLPQSFVHELLDELLWPKHPLGMSVIGSVESVSRIKREDLFLYKEQHYAPLNIVVSAAGQLKHGQLTRRVKNLFSHLKSKNTNTFLPAKVQQLSPQLKVLNKDTEQTHLALGFHGLEREHPLRHALGLLHIILGANMSSRLFNEVREKRGLAYEIGTQVKRFEDTGALLVHAGMDNNKVTDALELILKELAKVKYALVSLDELRRAKEFYLGQLMLALEDTMDYMLWIGESVAILDKTYTLKEIIREVTKVKREDLRAVAQGVLREQNLNCALIGPLQERKPQITEALHIG